MQPACPLFSSRISLDIVKHGSRVLFSSQHKTGSAAIVNKTEARLHYGAIVSLPCTFLECCDEVSKTIDNGTLDHTHNKEEENVSIRSGHCTTRRTHNCIDAESQSCQSTFSTLELNRISQQCPHSQRTTCLDAARLKCADKNVFSVSCKCFAQHFLYFDIALPGLSLLPRTTLLPLLFVCWCACSCASGQPKSGSSHCCTLLYACLFYEPIV